MVALQDLSVVNTTLVVYVQVSKTKFEGFGFWQLLLGAGWGWQRAGQAGSAPREGGLGTRTMSPGPRTHIFTLHTSYLFGSAHVFTSHVHVFRHTGPMHLFHVIVTHTGYVFGHVPRPHVFSVHTHDFWDCLPWNPFLCVQLDTSI